MCERYILVNTQEQIEARFGASLRGESLHGESLREGTTKQSLVIQPNYNISPGQFAPIITDDKPHEIQLFKFGLTPFWARSEMNLFNARAEGDYNQANNPGFKGAKGIILKPAFRKPIRSQRCIVIASAFIMGPSYYGLSKPFLIYLRNHQNPFAIAGIWDTWLNPVTGFKENSFSIITTTANSLLRHIGNSRMPVILSDSEAKRWINSATELSTITQMLNQYDSRLMNAYPISPHIKNPEENDKQLIQPTGSRLLIEEKRPSIKFPYTSGYHQSKKADKGNDKSTMADRIELAISHENHINN